MQRGTGGPHSQLLIQQLKVQSHQEQLRLLTIDLGHSPSSGGSAETASKGDQEQGCVTTSASTSLQRGHPLASTPGLEEPFSNEDSEEEVENDIFDFLKGDIDADLDAIIG